MPIPKTLADARNTLLEQAVHAIGRIVLHVTGDSRLSAGERKAAAALLRDLLDALTKDTP